MEKKKTSRGFIYWTFTDSKDVECSLQESSDIEPSIWFGCDNADPQYFVPNGNPSWRPVEMPDEYVANTRMHLTQQQVIDLLPLLECFAHTGGLDLVEAPDEQK